MLTKYSFVVGLGAIASITLASPELHATSITSAAEATATVSGGARYQSEDFPFTPFVISKGWTSPGRWQTQTFDLSVPGISLPSGSTLDGAQLTLLISAPSVSVSQSRNDSPVGCIPVFFTCIGWDDAASASFSPGTEASFTTITSGNSKTAVNLSDGTLNLIALGFGQSVTDGQGFTLSESSGINVAGGGVNLYDTGWNADTMFNVNASASWNLTGVLTVDYTLARDPIPAPDPTPSPEPADLLPLGLSLFAISSSVRRFRRRNVQQEATIHAEENFQEPLQNAFHRIDRFREPLDGADAAKLARIDGHRLYP